MLFHPQSYVWGTMSGFYETLGPGLQTPARSERSRFAPTFAFSRFAMSE